MPFVYIFMYLCLCKVAQLHVREHVPVAVGFCLHRSKGAKRTRICADKRVAASSVPKQSARRYAQREVKCSEV